LYLASPLLPISLASKTAGVPELSYGVVCVNPLCCLSMYRCVTANRLLRSTYVVAEHEYGCGQIEQVPVERILKQFVDEGVILGSRLPVVTDGVQAEYERVVGEQHQPSVTGEVGLGQQQVRAVFVHRHHPGGLPTTSRDAATRQPRVRAPGYQVRLSLLDNE